MTEDEFMHPRDEIAGYLYGRFEFDREDDSYVIQADAFEDVIDWLAAKIQNETDACKIEVGLLREELDKANARGAK